MYLGYVKEQLNEAKQILKENGFICESAKLSVDELKEYIRECENKYHASFKGESCKNIMNAYYEWQNAKKRWQLRTIASFPKTSTSTKPCMVDEFWKFWTERHQLRQPDWRERRPSPLQSTT